MKYKIFIAVMGEAEAFRKCVEKCPDKSKLIIVNNWNNRDVFDQCQELEKQGAEVQYHPENIGCGGAMNVGLKKVVEENLDFVIILSPSALFTNSVQDFVDIIEETEKKESNYYYLTVANLQTDLHAFAVTRKCIDEIGLYDENFYPVYYDDTDYGRRMQLANAHRTLCTPPRISQNLGGGLKSDQLAFDLYWANVEHIHDYYIRKWGGEHTQETFTTPFNDPTKTIKDWEREESKIIKLDDLFSK